MPFTGVGSHNGVPTLGYHNLTVKPVYNANRDVEKAVSIGYDVFAQVEARRRAEVLLT